uniref:Uncharacterized protein n=1 Tax=Podoviridae sp. ctLPy3 TaxID=2825244 RepID=A0A8S5UWI7_9CAUD|nr:MAG TPA: hypothetical protein [Podoviridae sp. ctLPy3]
MGFLYCIKIVIVIVPEVRESYFIHTFYFSIT